MSKRHATPVTARFWIWYRNDFVRIALKGETASLTVHEGGPTDEGYDHSSTTYTREPDGVWGWFDRDARDCDGGLSTRAVFKCAYDQLAARDMGDQFTGFEGMMTPEWEKVTMSQRDEYAEAMGY